MKKAYSINILRGYRFVKSWRFRKPSVHPSSYFSFFVFHFSLLFLHFSLSAQCNCDRRRDSLALKKLYESTGGSNTWGKKWDFTKPMTDENAWFGIWLTPEGCVQGIDLDGDFNRGWSGGAGGNGLNGTLPPQIGDLCKLEWLILRENPKLGGILPNTLDKMSNLLVIWVGDCSFRGPFPNALWQMPNIASLEFTRNKLSTTIPREIGNLTKLRAINFEGCDLSGTVPTEMGNLNKLQCLYLANNPNLTGKIPISFRNLTDLRIFNLNYSKIDSLPDLSNLPYFPNVDCGDGYFICENRLTFDDILPQMPVRSRAKYEFCGQDSVFHDTTITVNEGSDWVLNLGFDGGLTSNTYRWSRNDTLISSLTSRQNRLILRGVKSEQAGVYTCAITNDIVTDLTLKTHKIRLIVKPKPTNTVTPDEPLGITPNGDGMNDFLIFDEITTGNYPKNELIIKNRWGQTVFSKTKYDNDWSGKTTNGDDLPAGTYYYILRLDINDGKIRTGDILLVR